MRTPILRACLALTALAGIRPAPARGQDLVLLHARVVDVERGTVLPEGVVVVRGGSIAQVGGTVPAGADLPTVDVGGMYLSPGLMDAHVHIATFDQARRALESGVTTVRSMGVDDYADVGLRELAAAGAIDAPEVLAAGYHIRPHPSEAFFRNHPEMGRFVSTEVRGAETLAAMARTMLGRGVDFIKLNATERAGLPDTDPRKQFYDVSEMGAVVAEVRRAGARGVAAHAHGDEGARAAVEAGVTSIEHGTYMSPETLRLMAERGTYLVPTVAIVRDLTIPGGDYESPVLMLRGRHMLPRVQEMVATAHELGVPIVAATDTGYGPAGVVRVSHELEELVGIGLTPLEALQAATVTAARLLGVDDHTGQVRVGLDGDLILTERNPLEQIGTLNDVLMVVNNGKIVFTKGDWFKGSGPISD